MFTQKSIGVKNTNRGSVVKLFNFPVVGEWAINHADDGILVGARIDMGVVRGPSNLGLLGRDRPAGRDFWLAV